MFWVSAELPPKCSFSGSFDYGRNWKKWFRSVSTKFLTKPIQTHHKRVAYELTNAGGHECKTVNSQRTYHSTRGKHRCTRRRCKLRTRVDRRTDFDVVALNCTLPTPRLNAPSPVQQPNPTNHTPFHVLNPLNRFRAARGQSHANLHRWRPVKSMRTTADNEAHSRHVVQSESQSELQSLCDINDESTNRNP